MVKVSAYQIARLQENVESCKRYHEQWDLAALRLLELDFHEILRESCENPFLSFICGFINGILRDLLELKRDEHDTRDAFGQHNIDSHVALIAALRDGHAAAVTTIMPEHMHCAEFFVSKLDASFPPALLKWFSSSDRS